ncbi:hypothetical protein NXV05_02765 [Parabacteroides johnsonii]|nr:hypothetical protein [Parabacteroides johnsonii]
MGDDYILIPQDFGMIPDWNTENGNILPLFASPRKTKNPDFVWKSGFYCLLLFFQVVPPGIEPFASVYSKILIDYTFTALSFMKAIELALHQIHRFS